MYDIETENRFWSKVETGNEDECWECVAMHLKKDGYGVFYVNGEAIRAHRFTFQLFHNRLIQDKMSICHKCDNRKCVNPHHLFEGTPKDNTTDMINKGKKAGYAKLSEKQVKEIRAKYAKGGTKYKKLAEDYGVNESQIGHIIHRKSWKHI